MSVDLETVDLDLLLVDATLGGQESRDFGTLIALELNDRSQLLILHKSSVASEILLEDLEHALLVKVLGQSLDGGQGLASVTLLDTNICFSLDLLGRHGTAGRASMQRGEKENSTKRENKKEQFVSQPVPSPRLREIKCSSVSRVLLIFCSMVFRQQLCLLGIARDKVSPVCRTTKTIRKRRKTSV